MKRSSFFVLVATSLLCILGVPFSQAFADPTDANSADLNLDGFVDFEDFAIFASQWLAGSPSIADFDNDGIVDFPDLWTFSTQWLTGTPHGILPQNQYSGGSGTLEDPYRIATSVDWQALMATPADWNESFILIANIDLQGIEMTPIGDSNNNFTGSLDGAGYIILNADINRPDYEYIGLFGYIGTGAKIRNLGLINENIAGLGYVGGLIGRNDNGNVSDCNITGSVSGAYYTGGLIGSNSGEVNYCYARGTLTSGINSQYIGGLIGSNSGDVNYCYSAISVTCDIYSQCIGGFIGSNSVNIDNCYSTGSVYGSFYSNDIGGFAGHNSGDVNYCYSTGSVLGLSNTGGLVGFNEGAVDNSFWDIQTSGQTASAGGTGKTTAEMKTLATFVSADWDFSDADGDPADWKMLENLTYPKLFWDSNEPLIMVAASDAPEWFKSMANYICDGWYDEGEINAALGNNRHVVLSSGTFNISAATIIDYNNITLEGQGPSTIIRNTSGAPYCVIYQFGPNHDITIRNLQIDNNDYGNPAAAFNKCLFINGNYTTVIGIDNHKYMCIKAHTANPDNRPVTGPDYQTYWSPVSGWGPNETWIGGKFYTGIDSCNNILIDGVTGHDSKAEVICVDYAENITIRDCNSYNGAWSGITVAHTRYSYIYNNQVRHCGESPKAGYQMARGINVIGSSHVSIHNNSIRDCMTGGIGVNETFGVVECCDINIYDNNIVDTIGGSGITVESSDYGSYSWDVNISGNYIDAYRQIKLDAGGVAVDNGDGTVTLPATNNGLRETFTVTITGTINYNGYVTLKRGTDDDHLVIAHPYVDEQFNGTETVSEPAIGLWFDDVINFNLRDNVIVIGPGTYWCYVTSAAFNGLVENNMYTANTPYRNYSPSTTFVNNHAIAQ